MAKGLLVRYTLSRIITNELKEGVSGRDPHITTNYRYLKGSLDISWNGQRLKDFTEETDQRIKLSGEFQPGGILQVSYIRK
jgi:hypothetical protein